MMGGGMMGGAAGMWLIGGLGFLVLVVGTAAVVVLLLRRAGAPTAPSGDSDARTVLDLRFARGEIDAEEYRLRRGMLADQSADVVNRAESR
jgi:putative membrane protein